MAGRARPVVAVMLLAIACDRGGRVPVELDLTATAVTTAAGSPHPIAVEGTGVSRRIVEPPGGALDLYVRVPRDAVLRFTLDPHAPDTTFRVVSQLGTRERVLAPRRTGEGDWDAALDGMDDGAIVRLRLENRGTTPLAWWGLRVTGTASPRPPVLDAALRPPPATAPSSVVLVVSDALRADHLSLYGYGLPTTPQLQRLAAAHGVVFQEAYAAGPSTPNSIPSLFTSRYPSGIGITFGARIGGTDRTLAEAFSLAGVRTAAFVGNPLLIGKLGYERGFGAYEIVRSDRDRYVHADVLVDRALEYLSVNREAPCFVYVHLMDTHTPFDPPAPYRGQFAGSTALRSSIPQRERAVPVEPQPPGPWLPWVPAVDEDAIDPVHYDEAILYVDEQIGRLVRGLDEVGVGARTLVLVTADHGEALGVEDDGTHWHGHSLYQELAHVPLVALAPWLPAGRRVPDVVSLIDVAPTLLDMASLPTPASFVGASLFAASRTIDPRSALFERMPWPATTFVGPGSIVEWGMREGPWKLLLEQTRARLFDLSVDPKETNDQSAAHPEIAGYLVGRIARLSPALGGPGSGAPTVPAAELERPLTEALKTLGYLSE